MSELDPCSNCWASEAVRKLAQVSEVEALDIEAGVTAGLVWAYGRLANACITAELAKPELAVDRRAALELQQAWLLDAGPAAIVQLASDTIDSYAAARSELTAVNPTDCEEQTCPKLAILSRHRMRAHSLGENFLRTHPRPIHNGVL